jgi:uncharacterized protein (DUF736 family)
MTQFDNTNTGVLFRNDQAGNDKRPNYKGKLNVAGVDYELAGWTRTGASGVPFLSLKVQTPRPKPQATQQASASPVNAWQGSKAQLPADITPFADDDIPF